MKPLLDALRRILPKRKLSRHYYLKQQRLVTRRADRTDEKPTDPISSDRLTQIIESIPEPEPKLQTNLQENFTTPTPLPPSDDRIKAQIKATAKQSISFQRIYPPDHTLKSLTFQGGCPIAPHGFDWPRYEKILKDGQTQSTPLTFMAQVNCADMPQLQSHKLPPQGVLYFFMDWENLVQGNDNPVVVYQTGNTQNWQTISPPPDSPACLLQGPGVDFKWLWHTENAEQHYPKTFPKWPMHAAIVPSYSPQNPFELSSPDFKRFFPLYQDVQIEALSGFHSPVLHKRLTPHPPRAGQTADQKVWRPFNNSSHNWPHNWLAIEMFAGSLLNEIWSETKRLQYLSKNPNYPYSEIRSPQEQQTLFNQIAVEAHGWVKKSRYFGHWEKPDVQTQGEFWRWLDFHCANTSLFAMSGPKSNEKPALVINRAMSYAATHASEASLVHSAEQASLIPPEIVAILKSRHRVVTRGSNSLSINGHHRMFGYPSDIDDNNETYALTHLPLMQFEYDPAISWSFGNCGTVQYWITPQDLENLAFENTTLTFLNNG